MQIRTLLTAVALALTLAACDSPAKAAEMTSPSMQASIDRGTITALRRSPSAPNLLRSAVKVEITPGLEKPIVEKAVAAGSSRVTAQRSSKPHGLSWQHDWKTSGDTLTIKTTFKNLTDQRRCVGVSWRFPFAGADYEPFFSGQFLTPQWPANGDSGGAWYSYYADHPDAHRLNMPLWCVYSPKRDVGVTVATDLQTPILPFGVHAERKNGAVALTVTRPQIRLEANGSNTVTLYVALHAGDWRSSLSWLRDRFPEQFYVERFVEDYENQIYTGISNTKDWRFGHASNLARLLDERLPRNSGTQDYRIFPWWGHHFPHEEPFLISQDTKWHYWKKHPDYPGHPGNDADYKQIEAFLKSIKMTDQLQAKIRGDVNSPAHDYWDYETYTQDKVRQKIKDRTKHGIKSIQYIDVSEVWKPWAREKLSDSLFKPDSHTVGGAIGQLESTTAIALPGSSWETALLDQVRNVIKHYPGMTGVFLDQVYYDLIDSIHDDGFSIGRDGKPFARQHWALAQTMHKIKKMLAPQKRIVVINQAWNSIEIGSVGDLMLCEGGGRGLIRLLESLKYQGIGNKLAFDQVPFEDEAHECLRYGWYMNMWTDPGDYQSKSQHTRRRFCRAFYPLFELLKGRTWVLEPHCLELPDNLDGNLFRRPAGSIVATVVTIHSGSTSKWTRTNVPVTVRVKNAASVKAAYVVTADMLGPRRIDFTRNGNEIVVNLTRHRSASAVLLATGGKHLSLTRFGVAPDNQVQLRLDNYSSDPWQWSGKIAGDERSVTVAPGASEFINLSAKDMVREFGMVTFEVESETRGVIPAIDPDKAPSPVSTFELAIEPAVAPLLAPPPVTVFSGVRNRPWEMSLVVQSRVDFMQGEKQAIQAAFTNNTAGDVTLSPKFSAKFANVLAAPKQIVVPAGTTTTASVTLQTTTPGAGELVMSADAPGGQVEAKLPFNVIANAPLTDEAAKIKYVNISGDVFYTGGGTPQVTLNGVKVGPLFSEWTPHPFSWYAGGTRFRLNADAAAAVASANKIEFAVPGSLNLKVRNLHLVVEYEDGRTAIMHGDPATQDGKSMTWQCPK